MKINRNPDLLMCLVFIFLFLPLFAQGKPKLDSLVNNLGKNFIKNKETAGLSVGIYNNGNSHFYNFGTTKRNDTLSPTKNTIYEVGSITKTFVSLVLANAVIEKKVSLNDNIRKYLDGTYPNLEYAGQPITLLNLANTTSGLPNWLPQFSSDILNAPADSIGFLVERIYGNYTQEDFYEALHNVVLDTVPGSKARHSNAAAQLLSYILEKVYKTPIEQLVQHYILHPLNMNHTSFLASKLNTKGLATGYNEKGNVMPFFTNKNMKGVGGLNSTTTDLMKFIKLQLNEKNKAIQLSHKNTFNAGDYNYALNWISYQHGDEYSVLFCDGGTYGFIGYILLYPKINSGIVFLSNENDNTILGKFDEMADSISKFLGQK